MILAYALFALGSPAVKYLVTQGGELGLSHPEAISFCNVLFVGNLCAGLILLAVFGGRTILEGLKTSGLGLSAVSVLLATLYPALLFSALERTTVTNVVLLSRFEAVLYALATSVFLGARFGRRQVAGYVIIAAGIGGLVLVGNGFRLSQGDALVLVGGAVFTADVLLAKRVLRTVAVESFTFLRSLVSAILFFGIALQMFGPHHFMDAFQGELWGVMTFYAAVIVVLANLIYYRALPSCEPDFLTKLALASPLMTIVFAFMLLGEKPDLTQVSAGLVILLGMLVAQARVAVPEKGLAANLIEPGNSTNSEPWQS